MIDAEDGVALQAEDGTALQTEQQASSGGCAGVGFGGGGMVR